MASGKCSDDESYDRHKELLKQVNEQYYEVTGAKLLIAYTALRKV